MPNVVFLQSEVENPYPLYAEMLSQHPVYFDAANNLWGIYSYAACQQLLNASGTQIPNPNPVVRVSQSLSDYAQLLAEHLVRLQNPPQHSVTRSLVSVLFEQQQRVAIEVLLAAMLNQQEPVFDWVESVARRLPAASLLAGFDFSPEETNRLLALLASLVKIMLPNKPETTISTINSAANEAFPLVEGHLSAMPRLRPLLQNTEQDTLQILSANLLGLLIQGYDAGRGLLSNTLLHYASRLEEHAEPKPLILEILRHDPPVQNTRRILTQSVQVAGEELQAGSQVLIVLAAANRDPLHFANPTQFDPLRPNNSDHLTFGAGIHECLARYWIVQIAVDTYRYLETHYPNLHILTEAIDYEPLVNVRLPRSIHIAV